MASTNHFEHANAIEDKHYLIQQLDKMKKEIEEMKTFKSIIDKKNS
jgi:hypothetical protein